MIEEDEGERCPICKGAGFVHPLKMDGKPDYSRVIPCSCAVENLREQKAQHYLKYCQLPADTEHMTFERFQIDEASREAYNAALSLAEEGGLKWLTLLGHVDRGKTHLAIAICRRWLERGKAARYAYVPLLLNELRRGFDLEGEEAYQYRFDLFCQIPLLLLDDIGVQKPSVWAMEQLHTIIDYRYINALPLVVTLNRQIDQIAGDDDHRIASRLQRFTDGKVIAIKGTEYRLRE